MEQAIISFFFIMPPVMQRYFLFSSFIIYRNTQTSLPVEWRSFSTSVTSGLYPPSIA